MAPGHGRPFLVNREDLLATEQKMQRQTEFFRQIIADPEANFGLDPSWCSIYPYQMRVQPGTSTRAEMRIRNYRNEPMKMEIALVVPSEWHVEPEVLRFDATAGSNTRQSFSIHIPRDWQSSSPRFAVAADVMCNRKYLGQITEAVVDIGV
jgi:hypothetical protein